MWVGGLPIDMFNLNKKGKNMSKFQKGSIRAQNLYLLDRMVAPAATALMAVKVKPVQDPPAWMGNELAQYLRATQSWLRHRDNDRERYRSLVGLFTVPKIRCGWAAVVVASIAAATESRYIRDDMAPVEVNHWASKGDDFESLSFLGLWLAIQGKNPMAAIQAANPVDLVPWSTNVLERHLDFEVNKYRNAVIRYRPNRKPRT